jgi:hypothetical protein
MKKIQIYLFLFTFSYNINAQINLYKVWLDCKYESNIISVGICSPAGECTWSYKFTLYSNGTFTSRRFDNQGCYAFASKSTGTFEVKDSVFTLKSIVPNSVLHQTNNLEADKFKDETGTKLVLRKRKLYLFFPSNKDNGYLLLKPKGTVIEIKN